MRGVRPSGRKPVAAGSCRILARGLFQSHAAQRLAAGRSWSTRLISGWSPSVGISYHVPRANHDARLSSVRVGHFPLLRLAMPPLLLCFAPEQAAKRSLSSCNTNACCLRRLRAPPVRPLAPVHEQIHRCSRTRPERARAALHA